jgi:hypothetical protein
MGVWEPPTLKQVLANQRRLQQLQRFLHRRPGNCEPAGLLCVAGQATVCELADLSSVGGWVTASQPAMWEAPTRALI